MGDLGEWVGGGTPSKQEAAYWTHGTVPWVSPKDMKTPVILETEDRITEAAVQNSATRLIPPGSVLVVTRSGILQRTVPVAVNQVAVTLNQDLKALVPNGLVLPQFVADYIRSRELEILTQCSKAGTTVASIDFDRLKSYPVPLPPLSEQRRIVTKIEELQARS
ncbi:MAG: restriction endonuclease subunit S, partial [Gemmatimonadota bacterium]|nr:restriction endonuclease subunit S [Gemmatimonadota bacterium]